ncbi:unnamed protein product [Sphagnum balticum]
MFEGLRVVNFGEGYRGVVTIHPIKLRRDYDVVFTHVEAFREFTFRDFCWARTMVGSRIFGLFIDGVKTDILAPFADMLNHKIPKQTSWNFLQSENGFAIESLIDIEYLEKILSILPHEKSKEVRDMASFEAPPQINGEEELEEEES